MVAPNAAGAHRATDDPRQDQIQTSAQIVAHALPETQEAGQQRVQQLDKRVSTARARLARAGFEAHIVAGGFVVGRWGQLRDLETLDELERFVEMVCGGAP